MRHKITRRKGSWDIRPPDPEREECLYNIAFRILVEHGYDLDAEDRDRLEDAVGRIVRDPIYNRVYDELIEAINYDREKVIDIFRPFLFLHRYKKVEERLTEDEEFIKIGIVELGGKSVSLEELAEWAEMDISEVKGLVYALKNKGDVVLERGGRFVSLAGRFRKISKIVKEKGKWCVKAESGRNMGCYDTKAEAEERLKQVEMFKHMKSSSSDRLLAAKLIREAVRILKER